MFITEDMIHHLEAAWLHKVRKVQYIRSLMQQIGLYLECTPLMQTYGTSLIPRPIAHACVNDIYLLGSDVLTNHNIAS